VELAHPCDVLLLYWVQSE